MRKYFTLIELIIVIVIIGILSAIVIPNITGIKEDAEKSAISNNIVNIQTAVDIQQFSKVDLPVTREVKKGLPQRIDFDKIVPKYIREKPDSGYYWLDYKGVVYGATTDLVVDVTVRNGLVEWGKAEGATAYQVYRENAETISKSFDSKLIPLEDGLIKSGEDRIYLGEEGVNYFVSSQDKYGNWTPPVGEDYVTEQGLKIQNKSVDVGSTHSVALKEDGSIVTWGGDSDGQTTNVPANNNFAAVSAGGYHNVVIKPDGSLFSWGQDTHNQVSDTPTGNDFISISAGRYHNTALKKDGTLATWGYDDSGQVSNLPSGNDFAAVSTGRFHSVALKKDGSIVSWGQDKLNQVSGTPKGKGFIAIKTKYYHTVALKEDGSIVSWGSDDYGEVSNTPEGNDFVDVSAGLNYSLAIKKDGSIVAWGWDHFNKVSQAPEGNDFVAVNAGRYHSIALKKDGTVVTWGQRSGGQVEDTPTYGGFLVP